MTRIGIYLRAAPGMGGTLQYNLSILAAAELLPRDEFEVVVAFSSGYWREKIQQFHLTPVYIENTFISRAAAELWWYLHFPVSIWRQLAPKWHPLTRELARQGCDIWIFPSQDSMSYWIPLKSVTAIHDLMHRYEPGFSEAASFFEYRNRERHYKSLVRWNAGILVDAEIGRIHVHESYGADMDMIHSLPFVPPAYVYASVGSREKKVLREKYSLPESFFYYPAQFWKHKNHENLVRALGISLSKCPDMQLVLSGGKKNNYAYILKLINRLGLQDRVYSIGYIEDSEVPVMYHCARALVMPTYFGPTNIPPLEAMACGCPVAVSGIYGMPEQLGDAALYFDPDSVEEISSVMVRLWSDNELHEEMKKKALVKSETWGIADFSARLGDIIRRV